MCPLRYLFEASAQCDTIEFTSILDQAKAGTQPQNDDDEEEDGKKKTDDHHKETDGGLFELEMRQSEEVKATFERVARRFSWKAEQRALFDIWAAPPAGSISSNNNDNNSDKSKAAGGNKKIKKKAS
jgi:hypothetical protein